MNVGDIVRIHDRDGYVLAEGRITEANGYGTWFIRQANGIEVLYASADAAWRGERITPLGYANDPRMVPGSWYVCATGYPFLRHEPDSSGHVWSNGQPNPLFGESAVKRPVKRLWFDDEVDQEACLRMDTALYAIAEAPQE